MIVIIKGNEYSMKYIYIYVYMLDSKDVEMR